MSNAVATQTSAIVDLNGHFKASSVPPGSYRLVSIAAAGWQLESALIDGQDTLDFPIEIRPGRDSAGAVLTFVDTDTRLWGNVLSGDGRPTNGYVVAYAAEPSFWTPATRRVSIVRTGSDGSFVFSGLPAGAYKLSYVADAPRSPVMSPDFLQTLNAGGFSVTLQPDGDVRQNLTVDAHQR